MPGKIEGCGYFLTSDQANTHTHTHTYVIRSQARRCTPTQLAQAPGSSVASVFFLSGSLPCLSRAEGGGVTSPVVNINACSHISTFFPNDTVTNQQVSSFEVPEILGFVLSARKLCCIFLLGIFLEVMFGCFLENTRTVFS